MRIYAVEGLESFGLSAGCIVILQQQKSDIYSYKCDCKCCWKCKQTNCKCGQVSSPWPWWQANIKIQIDYHKCVNRRSPWPWWRASARSAHSWPPSSRPCPPAGDDSEGADNLREAIIYCGHMTQKLLKPLFKVQFVLMVHFSSSYCAREKHGQDSSQ